MSASGIIPIAAPVACRGRGTATGIGKDGDEFGFIEIPIEQDVTTIVGANESGKSHLLSGLSKVLTGKGGPGDLIPTYGRTDLCHFPGASSANTAKTAIYRSYGWRMMPKGLRVLGSPCPRRALATASYDRHIWRKVLLSSRQLLAQGFDFANEFISTQSPLRQTAGKGTPRISGRENVGRSSRRSQMEQPQRTSRRNITATILVDHCRAIFRLNRPEKPQQFLIRPRL
jgi:hypothetical protein